MKNITYLFGAGLTHSEVVYAGGVNSLLTIDITDGIRNRLEYQTNQLKDILSNDLSVHNVDVEQIISLYDSTGTHKDKIAATFLRDSFMAEVINRLRKIDKEFKNTFKPSITCALLEMHKKYGTIIDEKISGIMTLNYDDLAERSLEEVYKSINLGFIVFGEDRSVDSNINTPVLLKLHGSFNWTNSYPVTINNNISDDADLCLWIPPGVEKKKEKFPFNILWGKAKEILQCDILRVIGCSLSRNDWQLIALLHAAKKGGQLEIEYIGYQDSGELKKKDYPYLGIKTIMEIDGFRKYLVEDHMLGVDKKATDKIVHSDNSKSFNCYYEWVRFRKNQLLKSLDRSERKLERTKYIKGI